MIREEKTVCCSQVSIELSLILSIFSQCIYTCVYVDGARTKGRIPAVFYVFGFIASI